MAKDSNKHASIQDKNGVLLVKGNFIRIPYTLLNSETYISLSPLAVKIYHILLAKWRQNKYTEDVKIAIRDIQKKCPSHYKRKDKKGNVKPGYAGLSQIQHAIGELNTAGFITSKHKHSELGTYEINYKWFTGYNK